MDTSDPQSARAVLQIVWADLPPSGDNAVVVAMTGRALRPSRRSDAIEEAQSWLSCP